MGDRSKIREEMMAPLPSQVLRAFASARRRASNASGVLAIQQASTALDIYEAGIREWSDSVDAMLAARGLEEVDQSSPEACAAFVDRVDLRALQKQYVRRLAIAAAREELARLLQVATGHGHGD